MWPFTRNRPLPSREPPRTSTSAPEIERLKAVADFSGGVLRNEVQAVQSAHRVYSNRLNLMADTLTLKGVYHEKGGF